MRRRRNERKVEVLNLVASAGSVTAHQLSSALNISIENSWNLLKHYHKTGLLRRFKGNREFTYVLSRKGQERLDFLTTRVLLTPEEAQR